MRKWLSRLILFLVSLTVLLALLLAGIFLFVNPDRLKPLVIRQVRALTGRELVIDGNLAWSMSPLPGIRAGHLALGNPPGFGEGVFFEAQRVTFRLALWPLLSGHIEVGEIGLAGLKLKLHRNAAGVANWSFAGAPRAAGHPDAAAVAVQIKPAGTPQPDRGLAFALSVGALDITDSTVSFSDEVSKQSAVFQQLNLHAKNISLDHPFRVALETAYQFAPAAQAGTLKFDATVIPHPATTALQLQNMVARVTLQRKAGFARFALGGDLTLDPVSGLVIAERLNGAVGDEDLFTGRVRISGLRGEKPAASGHLRFNRFDLAKLLDEMEVNGYPLQEGRAVHGQLDFAMDAQGQLKAAGELAADSLKVAGLVMQHASAKLQLNHGVLDVQPITAQLYHGRAAGELHVRLAGVLQPASRLRLELSGIESAPLLRDLGSARGQKMTVAGLANVSLALTATGSQPAEIVRHLDGTVRLRFTDGNVEGVNLYYLLDSAYAFARHDAVRPMPSGPANRTPFGTLSASGQIAQGILSTRDILLDGPRLLASGGGTINLIAKQLDINLKIDIKKAAGARDSLVNLYGIPVSIQIAGDLASPRPRLDTTAIATAFAQKELEKVVNDRLKIHGHAGDVLNQLLRP